MDDASNMIDMTGGGRMGAVWRLVEDYIDAQEYPPSISAVSERAGFTGRSTLTSWQNLDAWKSQDPERITARRLPQARNLRSLAHTIGQPYRVVLDAVLVDLGYLTADEAQPPRPYPVRFRHDLPEGAAARRRGRRSPKVT